MNSAKRRQAPRRIFALVYPGVATLDVVGPLDVFAATGFVVDGPAYEVRMVGDTAGPVSSAAGLGLVAKMGWRSIRGTFDTLLVPGALAPEALRRRDIVRAIQRLAPRASRLASVCSGAFLLGEAGLLDGRRATTHWRGCRELAEQHPTCQVEPDAIFVRDGALWTSAGVTAGMDMALAIVEADHGADVALAVARLLVMYVRRPGGQSQFSAPLRAQTAAPAPLRDLALWVREHLAEDLSVSALAERTGMSERNFARVFRQELGNTPARWVTRMRLEAARDALESGHEPIGEVARAVGYEHMETFDRAFVRHYGVTPRDYRQRFAVARSAGPREPSNALRSRSA